MKFNCLIIKEKNDKKEIGLIDYSKPLNINTDN